LTVFVYVEGESDRLALNALLDDYGRRLNDRGHGLKFLTLRDKRKFLRKIGPHAAQRLLESEDALVIALPDLCPPIENPAEYKHRSLEELRDALRRLVREALRERGWTGKLAEAALERFYASAFKHEMEMLLLAAQTALSQALGARINPSWRRPVEEQNCTPTGRPKYIVEDLFRRYRKRRYADTKDAAAVLSKVHNLRSELLYHDNQLQCPIFKELLDWLGEKTGVAAY